MGEFAIGTWLKVAAWLIATTIVVLNAKLVFDQILEWFSLAENPVWLWLTVVPLTVACAALLFYITFQPLLTKTVKDLKPARHHQPVKYEPETKLRYKRVAITLDFSDVDQNVLDSAIAIGGTGAEYMLIHIVETAGALVMGQEIHDMETTADWDNLKRYAEDLRSQGYTVRVQLGFGSPKQRIPKIVHNFDADLLVMGSHGHKMVKDLILGTTIDAVRHAVNIPMLIV
ncbi:hypothetical protein GCM10028895_09960 [Pontibacter rugosus]